MVSGVNQINNAIVKAGSLIDGSGHPIRVNVYLLVREGLIVSISGSVPAIDLPLVDLSDKTLLPGLIDSHVHLSICSQTHGPDRSALFAADYETIAPVIRRHVACHWRHGVVAVRDGGDAGAHVSRFARQHHNDDSPPLSIKSAGRAFYKPGRYGRIVGGQPVDNSRLLDAIVRNMELADHIKLINSGINSLTVYGAQTEPQFQPDELRAIVRLARQNKRKVMVHANGVIPVREAVEAGVDSIEHGFFMGRDNLERMAERGVCWVPTAGTMQAFVRLGREGGAVAARNLESQLEQMAFARKAGVRIALGTDAGSPGVGHGDGVFTELALLLKAGYTMEQAVQCATANSADLCGFPRLGRLQVGSPACFIAVRGTDKDILESPNRLQLFFPGHSGQ